MSDSDTGYVSVTGIGGIIDTEIELPSGLTVLEGANASNRTSMIHAINAVLGGSRGLPHVSAGEGTVEMELDDETYHRSVHQAGESGVAYSGSPVTDETEVIDTYVTLDSRNPIRRAVMRGEINGGELRDLLMIPVDDDEIRRRIQRLRNERDSIDERLEELEEMKERLPELEAERAKLADQLAAVENELESKREEIEQVQVDVDAAEGAEELLSQLEEAERELDAKNERLSDAAGAVEAARDELENLRDRKREIESSIETGVEVDEDRIEEMENRRNRLDGVVDLLSQAERSVRQFSSSDQLPDEMMDASDTVLAGLSQGEQLECWACGSIVSADAFDEQADRLSSLARKYRDQLQTVEGEIIEIREKQKERERRQDTLSDVEARIRERERTVQQYEDRVERLEQDVQEQQERVADLQQQVEETEDLRDHPIVDLHDEARELSREQGRLERELDDVTEEIEEIEQTVEEEENLQKEREELSAEIETLNARVAELETDVVDRLQNHLDSLVDLLDYDGVERVRVDLKRSDQSPNAVVLTVVRDAGDGAVADAYGPSSLSESERSLVGLATALAAYQTHNISEDVPIVLVDSVEEFDGERIARLISYVADELPRVVVSLLPADADGIEPKATVSADVLS